MGCGDSFTGLSVTRPITRDLSIQIQKNNILARKSLKPGKSKNTVSVLDPLYILPLIILRSRIRAIPPTTQSLFNKFRQSLDKIRRPRNIMRARKLINRGIDTRTSQTLSLTRLNHRIQTTSNMKNRSLDFRGVYVVIYLMFQSETTKTNRELERGVGYLLQLQALESAGLK